MFLNTGRQMPEKHTEISKRVIGCHIGMIYEQTLLVYWPQICAMSCVAIISILVFLVIKYLLFADMSRHMETVPHNCE